MDNNSSGFWFQRARNWATSLVPNPDVWYREIDSIQDVSRKDAATAVPSLLHAISRFLILERLATQELMNGQFNGPDDLSRPPVPLYIDLVKGTHSALVELGSNATQHLIAAYDSASTDPSDKPSILWELADIRDDRTIPLFRDLDEKSIADMVRAESARILGGQDTMATEDCLIEARQMILHLQVKSAYTRADNS